MAVDNTTVLGSVGRRTIAILGCGALGTAILLGLLSDTSSSPGSRTKSDQQGLTKSYRFIPCVRRDEAADTIRQKVLELSPNAASLVEIKLCHNVDAVREADIVLLAVQPHLLVDLLHEPHMKDALVGKIIISVLAGVTVNEIRSALQSETARFPSSQSCLHHYTIVRAMPNINCFAKQSTTIIERGSVNDDILNTVSDLFRCVGEVFFTEPSTMDACTALCGSTPAFFTVVLEGLVEGAIAAGLKPDDALQIVSHAMMGTASLISQGRQPASVRHQVTSPGGSTIKGVLALEESGTRWNFARALRVAAAAAADLGSSSR